MLSRKRNLILILIAATFFAYFSSLSNPFIWDDEQFITSNHYVLDFNVGKMFTTNTTAGSGVQSNYYRPLTTLSFAVDAAFWGVNPYTALIPQQDSGHAAFGFHLTNLTLHIGAGILLFALLGELGLSNFVSFVIALFFLIHPIQTEAVTYINSRGDSLYTFILFLSLWLFIKKVVKDKSWIWGIIVSFLYLCSILSKEIALTDCLLYIVVILLFSWRKKISQSIQLYTKAWITALGAIVIAGLYWVIRLTVLNFDNTLNYYGTATFYSTHLWVRLFTFCKVLWIYLGLLVWPYPLHMERSVTLVTNPFSLWVISIVGLFGVFIGLGILEIKKQGTPWILFGLSWFVISITPGSGIIPINGMLYEHWLYVPMIGFFIMLYGLVQFIKKYFQSYQNLLISFVILLSILYIVLTIKQNNIWSDPIGFYRYTLSFAPDSSRLHNNLGMSLANTGDTRDAIVEYQKALGLGLNYPQIYNNLGNAQIATGDYAESEKNLKKALQLAPLFDTAKLNLIKLYVITKQFDKAVREAQGNEVLIQEIQRIKTSN